MAIDDCYMQQQLRQSTVQFTAGRHASVNLLYHNQHDHDEEKRRKQNLIVRSGKSNAEVKNIALDVLLKLTTDRHEASRGLSATAGLLIL